MGVSWCALYFADMREAGALASQLDTSGAWFIRGAGQVHDHGWKRAGGSSCTLLRGSGMGTCRGGPGDLGRRGTNAPPPPLHATYRTCTAAQCRIPVLLYSYGRYGIGDRYRKGSALRFPQLYVRPANDMEEEPELQGVG